MERSRNRSSSRVKKLTEMERRARFTVGPSSVRNVKASNPPDSQIKCSIITNREQQVG